VRLAAVPSSIEVSQGSCGGGLTEVLASVDDSDGVAGVEVHWNNGVEDMTTVLADGGGTFRGLVGTFVTPGDVVLTVVATDTLGAETTAELPIQVTPCPPG